MPNLASLISAGPSPGGDWRSNSAMTPKVLGADGSITFTHADISTLIASGDAIVPGYATLAFAGFTYYGLLPPNALNPLDNNPTTAASDYTARKVGVIYGTSLNIDCQLTSGAHQVAIYHYGSEPMTRVDAIDDADGTTVLATVTVADSSGGIWTKWSITGNVSLKVIATGGSGHINAIMFDPVSTLAIDPPVISNVLPGSLTVTSPNATGGTP
jgi:hypothetical protein